jgi:hypothetical protein
MDRNILVLCLLLDGCASNHFGRELPVIPEERAAYGCPAIALEIAKCDAFTRNVYQTWSETKGRRAGAFAVDLSIGDRRERNDALESAANRRAQLVDLGHAKSCAAPPPAPTEDD